jgi:sugar phosphate isomerase/epimerase
LVLSLNVWTTKRWSLPEAVDGCVRHGIGGIGLWRDKVADVGLDAAVQLVTDAGLTVTSLCRGGFFTAATPDGAALDPAEVAADNRRAVDEAATLGARTLVLVVGGLPSGSRDLPAARATVLDGIAELVPYAAERGVRLSIEPLHPMFCADRAVVSTLAQALDMCDRLDAPNVGVCVDTYHIWWDPQVHEQIARAGERIHIFQACDFLVPIPADALLGRGHVGDGVADIPALARAVAATGYDGPVEVEIFNQEVWDTPGDETLRAIVDRHATHLAGIFP